MLNEHSFQFDRGFFKKTLGLLVGRKLDEKSFVFCVPRPVVMTHSHLGALQKFVTFDFVGGFVDEGEFDFFLRLKRRFPIVIDQLDILTFFWDVFKAPWDTGAAFGASNASYSTHSQTSVLWYIYPIKALHTDF